MRPKIKTLVISDACDAAVINFGGIDRPLVSKVVDICADVQVSSDNLYDLDYFDLYSKALAAINLDARQGIQAKLQDLQIELMSVSCLDTNIVFLDSVFASKYVDGVSHLRSESEHNQILVYFDSNTLEPISLTALELMCLSASSLANAENVEAISLSLLRAYTVRAQLLLNGGK